MILEDLSEFLVLDKKKKNLQKKRLKLLKKNSSELYVVEEEIRKVENEIRLLKEIMSLHEEQYFLGRAIVSLNTEAQKNLLIERLP